MATDIVILAAGHGKRMQSDTPKVLSLLHGKPLISYLLEAIKTSGISDSPVIVVGQKKEQVMETLGDRYRYAIQEEQLGTGHAVMSAETLLKNAENVLVLYGDMPYMNPDTIRALVEVHESSGVPLTMGTVTVENFEGDNQGFYDFGRIVRNEEGAILRIVEKKDATEEELRIQELNPSYFCAKGPWLWENLKKIKNQNMQKEYYLTDLVSIAIQNGDSIETVSIPPKDALGVNTKEHLEILHHM